MEAENARLDDTIKGTTMGDPDGPFRFIETLGASVPTYIDPRKDLLAKNHKEGTFKFIDYHVPFQLRADFKPEQWPVEYYKKVRGNTRVDAQGFTLCGGISKGTGVLCAAKAVNRTHFCRNHGGCLHPADKKLSIRTVAEVPQERVDKLDRVQKFMQGFLLVEELDDDELTGNFVRTNAGNPVKGKALGIKFEQAMSKELHRRLNDYLKSKAPRVLEVMYEIADSDMVEPADRIKAAQWIAERVIGKTPDVLVNVSQEKPYEGILDSIQSGSREDYREKIASSRPLELVQSADDEYAQEVDLDENGSVEDSAGVTETSVAVEVETVGLGSGARSSEVHEGSEEGRAESEGNEKGAEGTDEEGGGRGGTDNDTELGRDVLERSEELVTKRTDAKNARDRLKKAKARRYAARAVGAMANNDIPLLIEWTIIDRVTDPSFGKFKMGLVLPDQITEAVLERVSRSNDPDIQAARLERAAAKLAGKMVS